MSVESDAALLEHTPANQQVIQLPLRAENIGSYMLKIELVPMFDEGTEEHLEGRGDDVSKDSILLDKLAVKTRSIFKLIFVRSKVIRQPTTTAYLYDFRDKQGNNFQWLTYRAKPNLETGKTYTIKATVKKYFNRKGIRIIMLTRGKIIS